MSNFSYIRDGMSAKERGTWIELVVAVGVFIWYVTRITARAGAGPWADVAFQGPMVRAVIISIVATIILHIIVASISPKDSQEEDTRDREISRFGEYVGMWPLVLGAGAGMILSMLEAGHFWIANAIYVGFVVSSITGSIAKLISYRVGLRGA